jgi:membrane protease YdiL (CAAX protease family)
MRNTAVTLATLIVLTAAAEGLILLRVHLDPWRLGAFLACLALTVLAFVGLSYPGVVKPLRLQAVESSGAALGMPFLLLIPYLVLALGTGTFSFLGLGKLAAYIGVPTLLLLPDRLHRGDRVGWRDLAAMLALALPVSAGWLEGIWRWPQEVYFFRPLFCVCVGAYGFLVVRNLEGVGYRLTFRKADVVDGLANFAGFALLGIPLGIYLGFIHFRPHGVSPLDFLLQLFGIYLTVAIPEELLFRGILQNFLTKSLRSERRGLYALLIASVVFGASHLHHPPVPNWRYGVLATLAGLFYGNAYRTRRRLSSPALTHALVDAVWHFWF